MSAVSALPEHFIANFVQQLPVRVEGIVDEVVGSWAEGEGKIRTIYVVDVNQVANFSGSHKTVGKIRLTVRQAQKQSLCQIGDRISAWGKLSLPRPGSNPGDPDYRAYFLRHGIGAVMRSNAEDVNILGQVIRYYPFRQMHQLRQKMGNGMTSYMEGTEAALLKGLVFGERTAIPAEIEWDFSDTGLVHILSVSGYHVALIAGVIYAFLRLTNCSEIVVCKVTMFCIGCYVLLVGFSPPVMRSAIMAAVLMGAEMLLRKKDALQALLVAGWLLLLWDPRQIYDIGFQLSFGATAGLIILSPGIAGVLDKYLPARTIKIVAATIAATLAVLPFLADYFQQISLISLLANLLLTFPVSLLIISGMLAAILGSFWPPLAYSIIIFNNRLTEIIIQAVNFFAAVPFASIHISAFPWWLAIVYYLLLAWVFQLFRPAFLPDFLRVWNDLRGRMLLLGACIAFVLIGRGYAVWGQGLEITFLDVGQGDAALIRTPHGCSILIDGGGSRGDGMGYDAGEKVIIPFLRREGIRSLDFAVLSHGHEDHAGGLCTVLRHIPIKGMLTLTDRTSKQLADVLDACSAKNIPVFPATKGKKIDIDGVSMEVLASGGNLGERDDGNEASIVIRVTYGEYRFLFTGDLEGDAEEKLLEDDNEMKSTVLKIGHHGSSKGTSQAFLDRVNPAFAIISVGETNPYGHPNQSVLQRLQERQIHVFRTDQDGAVSFWSDGQKIRVKTLIQK
jgi:competence protein ComEC